MREPKIYRIEEQDSMCLTYKVKIPVEFIESCKNWDLYVISLLTKFIQKIIKESNPPTKS